MAASRKAKPLKALSSEEVKAITHFSQIKFHRSFTFQTQSGQSLRATYADVDYREESDRNGPVLLYLPGMYGGRFMASGGLDALARKHRLRLLIADKPGTGGTTPVAFEKRVEVFTELIEQLLDHLGIKHVALMSHSAGTVFNFNVLLSMRHRLHPESPYVCFLAPWVPQKYTGRLGALSVVPTPVIEKSNTLIHFIDSKVVSKFKWASPALTFLERHYPTKPELATVEADDTISEEEKTIHETRMALPSSAASESATLPFDSEVDYTPENLPGPAELEIEKKYIFSENTDGGPADALLCLKRGVKQAWGLIDDYPEAIDKIIAVEKAAANNIHDKLGNEPNGSVTQGGKLAVQAFFAEDDYFIGNKGTTYFDKLWKAKRDESHAFYYRSEVAKGTQHDTLLSGQSGQTMDVVFGHVKKSWTPIRD